MLKKEGVTILLTTHYMEEAYQICDRLIVMKKGVVVEQGPTREVYSNPRNDYTRLLLEAAPGTHVTFGSDTAG